MLSDEIRYVANLPVNELLDPDTVRAIISECNTGIVHFGPVAELARRAIDALEVWLKHKNLSAQKLLDKKVKQAIDDLLTEEIELTEASKEFVGKVMRAEFIRRLFTDVIHVSIVSFYKKVNPLFGGLATKMLENQIRGFIEMFIKIVLDRAVAFVVSKENVDLFTDFAREVVRLMLEEPAAHFLAQLSPAHREKIEIVVRKVAESEPALKFARDFYLKVFDNVYHHIKGKKVGHFLALEKNAEWLGRRLAGLSLPWLQHPPVMEFIAKELCGH